MDSCGEYFLFYGLTDFVIFSSGLKVWLLLLLVQDTFRLSLPGVLAWALSHLFMTMSVSLLKKTPFLIPYFRWRKKGAIPAFGILANHLASIFLPPLSGDSLGLLYIPVPPSLPIWSPSTNICWFPSRPGFVTSGLNYITISLNGHSLVNSNTDNSGNSLFLFS